jgi:hypothetical protein
VKVSRQLKAITNVLVLQNRPHAPSGKTECNYHQTTMKDSIVQLYKLAHPSSRSNLVKCMVLNKYFPPSDICCSHIIGLRLQNSLPVLGLHDDDLWNPRNGLGLHVDIEKKFENLEVVCSSTIMRIYFKYFL